MRGAVDWIAGLLRGDLGASWVSGEPVAGMIGGAWLVSLNLAGVATLVSLLLALLLVWPALDRVSKGRRVGAPAATATFAILASIPTMVLAVVLVALFAVRWRVLPSSGWREPIDMVLPTIALALPLSGILARVLTSAIAATANEEWLYTWRANGCRRRRLLGAVAHRAVAVAVPQVFLVVAGTIGAAVLIEEVFAIPGLGRLSLSAGLAQDVPVVQGALTLLVATGLALGVLGITSHRLLLGPTLRAGQGAALAIGHRPHRRVSRVATVLAIGLALVLLMGAFRTEAIDTTRALMGPSWAAPLGTDALGRDMWARMSHGSLLTIGLALLCSAISLALGAVIGLANSANRPGAADVLNAVPPIFMGIILAAVMGAGVVTATVAVCAVGWIPIAVHARALGSEIRATGFYQAGRLGGGGRWWMLSRHLVPMALPPLLQHALIRLPHLALALTGLSFLGIGAPHDSPEWGKVLSDSVLYLEQAPWIAAAPSAGLIIVGLIASFAGDDAH